MAQWSRWLGWSILRGREPSWRFGKMGNVACGVMAIVDPAHTQVRGTHRHTDVCWLGCFSNERRDNDDRGVGTWRVGGGMEESLIIMTKLVLERRQDALVLERFAEPLFVLPWWCQGLKGTSLACLQCYSTVHRHM